MNLLTKNTNNFIELKNGKTVQAECRISYEIDYDFDASFETPELQEQLAADKIVPLVASVVASVQGVEVEDYLGAIFVSSEEQVADSILEAIENTGLQQEVLQQLEDKLNVLVDTITV